MVMRVNYQALEEKVWRLPFNSQIMCKHILLSFRKMKIIKFLTNFMTIFKVKVNVLKSSGFTLLKDSLIYYNNWNSKMY